LENKPGIHERERVSEKRLNYTITGLDLGMEIGSGKHGKWMWIRLAEV
jgi:hypothetical protein